jgi:sugar O-acyltransferase (sialic acid O-acetyltransferase NeuD family)
MSEISVFGAGGLGREIAAMIGAIPGWSVAGFYDDAFKPGENINKTKCLGGMRELASATKKICLVVAVGDPKVKAGIVDSLEKAGRITSPSLIHPTVCILDPDTVSIGDGTMLTAGCVLTTNIRIGVHTLVNLNSTIGHDTVIGSYCTINPGVQVSGQVTIGDCVLIGTGASILNGVHIGDGAKVGAGAVVLGDVPPGVTVVGVPARQKG